ncbi:MAG: VanZ family protein [Clostridia bacterium]|nr:VanZ family protein [Clostridia bacterium]
MYLIALFSLTIVYARSHIKGINLIPFQDLTPIYKHIPYDMLEGYILNVLLFVPYGYLLPYIKKKPFLKQTVLYSFLLSLCIEYFQFLFKRGIFDIDDLICNTVGGLIGGMIFHIFRNR